MGTGCDVFLAAQKGAGERLGVYLNYWRESSDRIHIVNWQTCGRLRFGSTALIAACEGDNIDAVRMLLGVQGINLKTTPLVRRHAPHPLTGRYNVSPAVGPHAQAVAERCKHAAIVTLLKNAAKAQANQQKQWDHAGRALSEALQHCSRSRFRGDGGDGDQAMSARETVRTLVAQYRDVPRVMNGGSRTSRHRNERPMYPIIEAVKNNCDPELLWLLIRAPGLNINQVDEDNMTALMHCCGEGSPSDLLALLSVPTIDISIRAKVVSQDEYYPHYHDGENALEIAEHFDCTACCDDKLEDVEREGYLRPGEKLSIVRAFDRKRMLASLQSPKAAHAMGGAEGLARALRIAASKGYADVVARLLELKADPNHPECDNVKMRKTNTVKVNGGKMNGDTALTIAAASGFPEVLRVLLAAKADPNLKCSLGYTAAQLAVKGLKIRCVELLLGASSPGIDLAATSDKGRTLLDLVPVNGRAKERAQRLRVLLMEAGVKSSQQGDKDCASKAIIEAAGRGQLSTLAALLTRWEGNVDVLNCVPVYAQYHPGGSAFSPLFSCQSALGAACHSANVEAVRLLLKTPGVKVCYEDKVHSTALHHACSSREDKGNVLKIVEMLLAAGAGANVNTKQTAGIVRCHRGKELHRSCYTDGYVPLTHAVENGHKEVAQLLEQASADPMNAKARVNPTAGAAPVAPGGGAAGGEGGGEGGGGAERGAAKEKKAARERKEVQKRIAEKISEKKATVAAIPKFGFSGPTFSYVAGAPPSASTLSAPPPTLPFFSAPPLPSTSSSPPVPAASSFWSTLTPVTTTFGLPKPPSPPIEPGQKE